MRWERIVKCPIFEENNESRVIASVTQIDPGTKPIIIIVGIWLHMLSKTVSTYDQLNDQLMDILINCCQQVTPYDWGTEFQGSVIYSKHRDI